MKNIMKWLSSAWILSVIVGQTDNIESFQKNINNYQPIFRDMSNPAIPLEKEIDPNEYLLGPGDQLHIVVTSLENKFLPGQEYDLFSAETVEYYEFIGPAGELTLPSIGQFSTSGKSYQQIKDEIIKAASNRSYKKVQNDCKTISITFH